jgi:uncharacterized protein (DUF1015 family)
VPDLRPFSGIRYSPETPLEDVVCPPYDVITPDEQRRLHERHPHNAVRVELPFSEAPGEAAEERYRRAGRRFGDWLREGVLVRDDEPALFVLRQDFSGEDGDRRSVTGVIGALRLEPFGPGSSVLPHERTMPGPVEDRLALLRACPVNISPIYGIYQGAASLSPYLDSVAQRPPVARVVDEHGTRHRMWMVRAPAEIDMLRSAVGAHELVIADGHHRYETALAYQVERDGAGGDHDAVMCLCVDTDSEDVRVLPYNRVLALHTSQDDIAARLLDAFPGRELAAGEGTRALHASTADHPFLFVIGDRDVLVEVTRDEAAARLPGRARAWLDLDVVVLHEVVIATVLADDVERVLFTSDAGAVIRSVRGGGWSCGVVLRPLSPAQVIAVARAGERMPHKASYFSPKALTGLVFRALTT